MSFQALTNIVNDLTQNYFGESATYKSGSTVSTIKADFKMQWIEVNSVNSYGMTCEILSSALSQLPKKNDEIVRGAKSYFVSAYQSSGDGTILTLILKD